MPTGKYSCGCTLGDHRAVRRLFRGHIREQEERGEFYEDVG